ncbi:MAG TPA: serine/threonine-protein kinase [Nitrolancea sp.]|nr:serine/threonine-protein kinase [Nitrolancea sp.]
MPVATFRPITDGQDLLSPGTILESRYEIQHVIGQGGMSTVYAARDLRFSHVERLCAIKEMVDRARDNQTRILRLANFEREASLLATLSHPAIPKIYDYFSANGPIYLVLEYIDGQDLENYISHSTQPVPETILIDWASQILDVLSYLHEHQPEPIVFRDMKPSNIMLRTDGSISLIDFGIARTFQPLQRGTMIGTEGYAPPEQYRGISEPRGDIYAMGATLHHLATKSDPRTEPPFTFAQRLPRELNPSLSVAFEQIILRAVAYSVADRFPSAAAMQQSLLDIREPDGNTVRPEPQMSPMVPSEESNFVTIASAQGTSAAEGVATPTEYAADERMLWSIQTADEVRGTATVDGECGYIGSYDQHLYAFRIHDGSIIWRFRAHRGIVSRPLVVGTTLVIGSEDHSVYAIHAATGRTVWTFRTAMPVRSSASQFGDAVIIGSDDGYCYCLDLEQGNLLWRQRAWGPIRSSPTVEKDTIVVGSDDGALHAFSAIDGRQLWRHSLGQEILSTPFIRGGTVYVGCNNGYLYAVDVDSGVRKWAAQTQGPIISSPRVVSDIVVVGSADGKVHAFGVADGLTHWVSQIATQITSSVSIDGRSGYVGTVNGYVVCLDLQNGDTRWSHKLGSPIVSTPIKAGASIIVGAMNGKIYSIRA